MRFNKRKLCVLIFCFLLVTVTLFSQKNGEVTGWKNVPGIMKDIKLPAFPKKSFDISKYGAVNDGVTDCTQSINNAIDACNKSGGGKVVISKGVYLTGAIYLKSNVNLFIAKNAVLKFSTDPKKYLPVVYTRWEGTECMNYSSLIYAFGEENIAVTGEGSLDGQGAENNWWAWKSGNPTADSTKPDQKKDRDALVAMGEKNVPVDQRIFGDGHYLRPNFIQFYKCKNVLVSGVKIINSPMWVIHPVLSQNVSVVRVNIEGFGPNTDGCDPECCKNVLIKDCSFNNGDDCIAIKSGRNNDGRRVNIPSENIIIQNCTMKNGHGGVVMGSEISGGVRNVFAENCVMDSPNLDRALRFKTNSFRGGVIENIFVRNIRIGQVAGEVMRIDFYYEEGDKGEFTPVLKNVYLENVKCERSKYAVWVRAYERSKATNINISNCVFNNVEKADLLENVSGLIMKKVMVNGKTINISE
jgi:polygalacturonase